MNASVISNVTPHNLVCIIMISRWMCSTLWQPSWCNAVGIIVNSQWNFPPLKILLLCNSVRVVLLIARGWRGTSLPRVSIHKEIQRRRCCAFSEKARLLWNLLWRINQKKHNTYGVETCIFRYDLFRLTIWFNGLSHGNNHYQRRWFK